MAEKARTTRPRRYAVTRRSERSTTTCQVVADCTVLAFLIQPVLLFGRPGSLTLSHRTPPALFRRPITGSTVRPSVIGRLRSTQTRRAEPLSGFDIAVCPRTNTASSCDRATVEVPLAGAGPVVTDTARMANAVAERSRGARVRTPAVGLMLRRTPSR